MGSEINTYGGRKLRGLLSVLVVTAALAICAGSVSAASVERDDNDTSELVYVAKAGLANNVTVTLNNGLYYFTDPAETISTPDNDCDSLNIHIAACPADPNNFPAVDKIRVLVLDQDDTVHNNTATESTIFGDSGDDELFGGTGDDYLEGSAGEDELYGSSGDDSIQGNDDRDLLNGSSGSDSLNGGPSDDTLDGGVNDDHIIGSTGLDLVDYSARNSTVIVNLAADGGDGEFNEGDDVESDVEAVLGGSGSDSLSGTSATNYLLGGVGQDALYGKEGNDQLYGGADNDIIYGGQDADTLAGDVGNDLLRGDAGDDSLFGQTGHDILGGDSDNDTVFYIGENKPVDVDLDGDNYDDGPDGDKDFILPTVENVTGGNGDDTIKGNSSANVLKGGKGNDTIDGLGGTDSLFGQDGNDSLLSADLAADDADDCGAGTDEVTADLGDTLTGCEQQNIKADPESTDETDQNGPGSAVQGGQGSPAITADAVSSNGQTSGAQNRTTKNATRAKIRVKSIKIKRGKVRIVVLCSGANGKCTGKLTLKTKRGKRLKTVSIALTNRKAKTYTLGKQATRAIRRASRVKVSVRVKAGDQIATQSKLMKIS